MQLVVVLEGRDRCQRYAVEIVVRAQRSPPTMHVEVLSAIVRTAIKVRGCSVAEYVDTAAGSSLYNCGIGTLRTTERTHVAILRRSIGDGSAVDVEEHANAFRGMPKEFCSTSNIVGAV